MKDNLNLSSEQKLNQLNLILFECQSVLVAYSGGVDSTFLTAAAFRVLGEGVLAVTARSETYPAHEYRDAVNWAGEIGVRHLSIETSELDIDGFSENPPDRCYYCKRELFTSLRRIADEYNLEWVADGSTSDDENDFRPGLRACSELNVRSPLREAGMTKEDIRYLSKKMGLPTWNKPSFACLSSRFPYGEQITPEKLRMVDKAEILLRTAGFKQVRVRHSGTTARIEVNSEDIDQFFLSSLREKILKGFRKLGYKYVSLDLEGYRTGSMNEVLEPAQKEIQTNKKLWSRR